MESTVPYVDEPIPILDGQHLDVPRREEYERWLALHSSAKGMDPRITPLVASLNARGLPTWGSCEGHPDDFPQGTWYPWVYIGTNPGPLAVSAHDYRGLGEYRDAAREVEIAAHEIVGGFYAAAGFPEDEIVPAILPLGSYGYFALIPAGVFPGGDGHRVVGHHLGLEGRRDFHRRAWREFDLLTEWLITGVITNERSDSRPPAES